jgi:STE24 endopeptidase
MHRANPRQSQKLEVTTLDANAQMILATFLTLRVLQHIAEWTLGKINRRYYLDKARQMAAVKTLGLAADDMQKTLAYAEDRYVFSRFTQAVSLVVFMVFLAAGGFGWVEGQVKSLGLSTIWTGVAFFGAIGALSTIATLPFGYYRVFVIEARHGFNRQTVAGFFLDRLKGIVLAVLFGAPLLYAILWIMESMGDSWWLYAWGVVTFFSIFTAWAYPTFIAPVFNKFRPVDSGELKEGIANLAAKIGFRMSGVFIMDASKRSSHGNAYFTGLFGKKRIVLFDTLVDSMAPDEVIAVLAHELGHFKLKHVQWTLVRGILTTGAILFLLSLCLPMEEFYRAFHFDGISNYAALIVFGMWFGIVEFLLQPLENYLSRTHEFQADAFARSHLGSGEKLAAALLKLREKSHVMPITHPLYSGFYYSHPPLIERLAALRA